MNAPAHISYEHAEDLELKAKLDAIDKSQAVIEFQLDGTILTANENFCNAVGYRLDEIQGQHHSMFVDPAYRNSPEYKEFWNKLNRGEFEAAEYKRIANGGREIWIQASYNPMFDAEGKPYKVVKFATDITAQKVQAADAAGQLEAINKSQAVIQFNMDGTIVTANENFCNAVGYRLDEIQGKHHSMFVEPQYKASSEYKQFWEKLNRGEYDAGEYKRIGNNGKEIWIQASYNPILDASGKPVKVVKYATDVTEQRLAAADAAGQLDAISKSQAVIEFNMDGTIRTANENFCNAVGYRLEEIQGRHHSLFVEPEYKSSAEYQQFWEQLNRGEFDAAEYKRIGNHGKEIWIQASYNPIMDLNGKPFKVVKYATDITGRKHAIASISDSLMSLSEGSLDATIDEELTGEFEELRTAMNETMTRLSNMVSEIRDSSSQVSSSAGEIQGGTADLSQRVEEQASSLEETSSSMEQMTSTVQQNAENAREADTLAKSAREKAEHGGQVMTNAVTAMTEINGASKRIADIISVIDEIAFQTNLLALNASVEAARAGEQGRGFAVVASEVRNLAGRSATAAKEIKDLIQDSVSKVEEGSRLVDESGKTLEEIISAVQSVTNIVGEISGASVEQAAGIEQVNKAIAQMDEMTQQNAALVEEASASSENMKSQAHGLNDLMTFFK